MNYFSRIQHLCYGKDCTAKISGQEDLVTAHRINSWSIFSRQLLLGIHVAIR